MLKSRRKKKEESKRRFEAIKDLMSTFAMTTIAVVAAVTLIPASPKTEITKAVALSEEIVYQVSITDADNALDLSTLFVVLENQLEFYEQPISLGESSGYFDKLEYDTQYRLSVYGSKGFGQERLDTIMISTGDKIGGTILSVITETTDYSTVYNVDVSINDPNSKYTSINLYYGYSWESGTDIQYSSIPVMKSRMNIELSDIYTTEEIHIYLEGNTLEGKELLDEIWVTPPFELYTSLYLNYYNSEEIGFYIYSDAHVENISYEMFVYKNDSLISTKTIGLGENEYEGNEMIIGGLSPNTTYGFEGIATYTNPQTLRQVESVIYKEEITTLGNYTYTYNVETIEDFMEVTISLYDPNHYFQNAFYESYDLSGDYDLYLASETYYFAGDGINKTVTFTVHIPLSDTYKIAISIGSQTDYLVKQIIDIIK